MKLFALMFLLSSGFISSANELQLYTESSALIDVINGRKAPGGIIEATNSLLFKRLQQAPNLKLVPPNRIDSEMAKGASICTFFRLKTPEREKHFLFSKPIDIFLGPRLYSLSSAKPIPDKFLDKEGRVLNLTDLFNLSESKTTLGLLPNSSYGAMIDKQIAEIKDEVVLPTNNSDPFGGFVRMFFKGRFEYMIMYPANLTQPEFQDVSLRSYEIVGNEPFLFAQIMCTDSDASRDFLHKVDAALTELYQDRAYVDAIKLFTPVSEHAVVDEIVKSLQ